MTNTNGNVTFSQNYDPYGGVTFASGASQSAYGFTGEAQSSDMVYLRARYYNAANGRFLSRDTWSGEIRHPLSLNRWGYAEDNPVANIDPIGHITEKEHIHADNISLRLKSKGVIIYEDWGYVHFVAPHVLGATGCIWNVGRWDIKDLEYIDDAMKDLEKALGSAGKIRAAVGQVVINKRFLNGRMMSPPNILDHILGGDIIVQTTATSTYREWYMFEIVHEFGHVWDYRMGMQLSSELMQLTGGWVCAPNRYGIKNCHFDSSTIKEYAPDTLRKCLNPAIVDANCQKPVYSYLNEGAGEGTENWAQALAYYVYPNYDYRNTIGLKSIRRQYVKKQIANLP